MDYCEYWSTSNLTFYMKELSPYIKKLTWDEARGLVKDVNQELVSMIDVVELTDDCEIFWVRYRYGDLLLDEGKIMLPNAQGKNVPIDDETIPVELKKKFAYAPSIPVGMSLNKNIEIFMQVNGRVVPTGLAKPGYIFALTAAVSPESSYDEGTIWNLSAGCRSVYSVPKISDSKKHHQIAKELGVSTQAPKQLNEHWFTFKEIANSPAVENEWHLDVLYFTDAWITELRSYEWALLNRYFIKYAWDRNVFMRSFHIRDFVFAKLESMCNLKPHPNTLQHMRHLISMGAGNFPGLSLKKDEMNMPYQLIQDVYSNIYKPDYFPDVMSLQYLDHELDGDSIYYSLQLPMLVDFNSQFQAHKRNLYELRDIERSLSAMLRQACKADLGIRNPEFPVLKGSFRADYAFFHNHQSDGDHIKYVEELLMRDEQLKSRTADSFCVNGRLFKGLVEIKSKPANG